MDLRTEIESISIGNTTVNYDDTSFQSSTGRIICLTGRNGTGKSLLLKAISGIIPHKINISKVEGAIHYNGDLLTPELFEKLRSSFALVAEEPSANVLFSNVHEEIIMDNLVRGIDKKSLDCATLKAVQRMGISNLLRRDVNELSSGELQKVILANALTRDVSIIFLDEPTQNLDRNSRSIFFNILNSIKSNVIIICATQDRELANFSDINIQIGSKNFDKPVDKSNCTKLLSETLPYIQSKNRLNLDIRDLIIGRKKRHSFRLGPIKFNAKGGQAVWIKGDNGSGKTTLLETLAGIRSQLGGVIEANGIPIRKNKNLKITFSQHPPTQTFLFTDIKHELSSLRGKDPNRSSAYTFAMENWNRFSYNKCQNRDPRTLSYGQQKVLNILCRDTCAEILIFDEPTSCLDNIAKNILALFLIHLKKKGRLIIFSSHDNDFADQIADLTYDVDNLYLIHHCSE